MALLILNNCLKTINKSFILFVIKSWPQIQNLTIVRAERDIFFKFKQNVRVWQNKNFSDVCPTLMFVFSDVWHSDVFPLWRLPLWRLSLWRLSTLTFVHSDVCLSDVFPSTYPNLYDQATPSYWFHSIAMKMCTLSNKRLVGVHTK